MKQPETITVASIAFFIVIGAMAESVTTGEFDVTGQVSVVCDTRPARIYLISKTEPTCFWQMDTNTLEIASGDIVHVTGYTKPLANKTIDHYATRTERLGHGEFPAAPEVAGSQVRSGELFCNCVRVRGVLVSVLRDDLNEVWNLVTLRTNSGKTFAAVPESAYPLDEIADLQDAEVVLSGFVTQFGIWRRFLGYELMLFGRAGIKVVKKPPADVFTAPKLTGLASLHRQLVAGTVIGRGRNRIFLNTKDGEFLPVSPVAGSKFPKIGNRITAVGFAEPDQRNLQLVEAVIRIDATEPTPFATPIDIDPETLYTDSSGHELANTEYYGKIIRVEGVVENTPDNISFYNTLQLSCGKRTVTADVSSLRGSLDPAIGPGHKVSVAGICVAEFVSDASSQGLPLFQGFTLFPRDARDFRVISAPSWWTPGRLVSVIAVLVLVLVAILIWNRMLKVLSERRGRALYREQVTNARAELKIEERTRLAVELHDSISQSLTGVAYQIDAAKGSGANDPAAVERFLDTARAMLASCRQELRCCIWDLRSRTFEERNMAEAMQKTLVPHIGDTDVKIRFSVPRSILSESSAHDTLRIIRELVLNAVRHGRAKHIRIAGEYRDGMVCFSVKDDGAGFAPSEVPGPAQGHFGLQGIRERVNGRNGEMSVESVPGRGTKVTVSFAAGEKEDDEP